MGIIGVLHGDHRTVAWGSYDCYMGIIGLLHGDHRTVTWGS